MSNRVPDPGRRAFLADLGVGFAGLALAAMLHRDGVALGSEDPWAPPDGRPHFPPRAKSVIWLFMNGGVSHLETFDPKPELTRQHGKPLPPSFGKVFTPMGVGGNNLLASKRRFEQHGESGMWVSDWYPHVAGVVDDIALVRSCWADGPRGRSENASERSVETGSRASVTIPHLPSPAAPSTVSLKSSTPRPRRPRR